MGHTTFVDTKAMQLISWVEVDAWSSMDEGDLSYYCYITMHKFCAGVYMH